MARWLDVLHSPEAIGLLDRQPMVFVDVGASGSPLPVWRQLAAWACFVGFDPDQRDRPEENAFGFRRFLMIDKAVSVREGETATFQLTRSPYCSSMLEPNFDVLTHYSFTELFEVERTVTAPATTLEGAVRGAGIERIDWLKLDSQGLDWEIYDSLGTELRGSVMALDVEPGVDAFYKGENTFPDMHANLLEKGFWLADARFHRYPRVERSTRMDPLSPNVDYARLPGAPTAFEARYFRSLDSLDGRTCSARDLLVLWCMAMQAHQPGFALDVALETKRKFPDVHRALDLVGISSDIVSDLCDGSGPQRRRIAERVLPRAARRILSRGLRWILGAVS